MPVFAVWFLAAFVMLLPSGAQAQTAAEFYKGRQLTLVVGYEVGNDYDLGARLLAKYLSRQLPGQPTIVVQNMPQAAGPKARSFSELEAAGVCSATFPSLPLFAAVNAVRNVVRLLKQSDSLAPCQEHLVPLDDYYNLVGLKDLLTREESYDKAAAALVQKRAAE